MNTRERYTSKWAWLRYGEATLQVEQTCELGTREVLMCITEVVYRAANRHIERVAPASARWGATQPRFAYHGKS